MTSELTISPLSRLGATGRREVKLPGSLHARDLLEDHVDVDGLHQMDVEPCLQRALAVLRLAIPRQRDQPETAAPGRLADAARQLVAVDLRQANVEQCH